jgi:WD40 repeat protein
MAPENCCPQCGAQLPTDAPEGLCPKCLMKVAMGKQEAEATLESSPVIEGPGAKIGRYELLELIGEGGMGLVYLAEQQEPVRRQVALKIVKPGMDSRQVIARFEAERQALALLDHSNIAHVFDAGTTETGRPYFVMEYVKGMSITRHCDQHRFSIEDRLQLFLHVCDALQHAHQKGIIHRDLKPSNILVSVQDDKAVPKIIDFGIAKAVSQPLTEKTTFTQQGQLLGTPEYMSPEQADMAYQKIDTRSDIYSLGAVLYVLLTGTLPFNREELEKAGFAELQRTLRETEPPHPSTRLTSLGKEAKRIAERRCTEVFTLARRLHKELEWIPLKAMRKDPIDRYRSVSELADDIRNYLNGAPLIAGPESALYRAKKFMRKHAGSVTTAALVAVAIVMGLVASIVMGCRAEQARKQEATARKQVEQALMRAENAEKVAQEQRKLAEQRAEDYRRSLYFNRIAWADVSYGDGNISRVRELLDSCPQDLRGWEWYRLSHISDQSCMTLRGHSDGVFGVAFSPDGKQIVSGSDDKTIKVWDAQAGTEVMSLRGHENRVGPVSFSPDGRQIISGSMDNAIKVWDATSGAELMTLRSHTNWIWSVGFSPDGKRIISASQDKTIKVWDAATGAELMSLAGHEGPVLSAGFSPDGKHIVSGSEDKTIKVWDAATGDELTTLRGHESGVRSVAFRSDGQQIASGSDDNNIKIWDASTGTEVMTLRGHREKVWAVAFSPDDQHIASGSDDNTIKVWDTSTGKEVMTLRGHNAVVWSVGFSPDSKHVISSGQDQTIKLWDVTIDRERTILAGLQGSEGHVAFSPDGTRLISLTGTDGRIKVWDTATGTELTPLCGRRTEFLSAAFSPDGKRIASASLDNTIQVWDASTGAELRALRGHQGMVISVAFSPDSKRIVSCGIQDKAIKVWDASTGAELMTLQGHEGYVFWGTFSPDGKRIIAGTSNKTLKVWDAATGAELMTLRGHVSQIYAVTFSPDGKRIVSGSENGTIKVWSAVSGEELMSVRGHTSRLCSVGFSPDGKRIISGSHDGTLKLWDSATGVEVMTLRGYGSATFSPDGKTIAFGTTLLETAAPPKGYGPRRTGAAARKLVDELYEKYGFYDDVIAKLNTDETLAEPVHKVALQIANARLCEDAIKLCDEIAMVVAFSGGDVKTYQAALQKADRLEPNHPYILNILGAARYRTGAYEEGLETLGRSEKIVTELHVDNALVLKLRAGNAAFMAMALHQLGRSEEARAALDRLHVWCKDGQFAIDKSAEALLAEAEKLFAGKQ